MSSQGPSVDTTASVAEPPFAIGPTGGTPVLGKGYTFTPASIRDASDWLAYKKQALVFQENKAKINQDPWFSRGNDYRLQYLLGRYKVNDGPAGCTGCSANAFGVTGPY
jgi:hypothetical protein